MSSDAQPAMAAPSEGTPKAWLIDYLPTVPDVAPDLTYIPAENYSSLRELEAAQLELTSRLSNIKVEIEKVRELAHAQGLEQGRRDALAELLEISRQFEQKAEAFTAAVEPVVARLACEVAGKIIDLGDRQDCAMRLAREALALHAGEAPLSLAVSPDVATDRRDLEERLGKLAVAGEVQLRVDPRLGPGRMVLFTRFGALNIDPTSRLEFISRDLLADEGQRTPEPLHAMPARTTKQDLEAIV